MLSHMMSRKKVGCRPVPKMKHHGDQVQARFTGNLRDFSCRLKDLLCGFKDQHSECAPKKCASISHMIRMHGQSHSSNYSFLGPLSAQNSHTHGMPFLAFVLFKDAGIAWWTNLSAPRCC